jgi:hypothetical protein
MKTKISHKPSSKLAIISMSLLSLSACSGVGSNSSDFSSELTDSGSIVLARPMPKAIATGLAVNHAENNSPATMLGFSANTQLSVSETRKTADEAPQISIPTLTVDISSATITVVGGEDISSEPIAVLNGADSLKPGNYVAPLKQKDPSWYAPDSYFTKRNLPVPQAFSPDRFLNGALGEFVIYLNENTAIHNAKLYSEEVGGLQISDTDMARLYYALEAGCKVSVK